MKVWIDSTREHRSDIIKSATVEPRVIESSRACTHQRREKRRLQKPIIRPLPSFPYNHASRPRGDRHARPNADKRGTAEDKDEEREDAERPFVSACAREEGVD